MSSRIASLVVCFVASLILPGCGTDLGDLCDAYCDCEGCSDHDYDNCLDDADHAERDADDEGCGSELGDYAACLLDNSDCHGNDFEVDYGDCDNEAEDLWDCMT